MKGFFGILNLKQADITSPVSRFLEHTGNNQAKILIQNQKIFICDLDKNSPNYAPPDYPALYYAGWVRLDNRKELTKKLSTPTDAHDAEYLLNAYQKWGKDCVQHLIGDFSFVIWDEAKQEIFLAKDQVGIRPLFYMQADGLFYFSTTIPLIKKALSHKPKLNEVYIAKQLKNYPPTVEETFFKDILRLKPAHYILTGGHEMQEKRYWELKPLELPKFKNKEDYYQLLRESMEEAIRCRVRNKKIIGSQLSGGMDSSAITVILSRIMDKKNLHTYSFVLDEETIEYSKYKHDEQDTQKEIISYSGLLEQNHHPITRFHYKDIFEELEVRNEVMGGLADSDSFWQDSLFKYAGENQGVEVMFSGFPGDEGISEYGGQFFYDYLQEGKFLHLLGYILEFRLNGIRNINQYFKNKRLGTTFKDYKNVQKTRDLLSPDSSFQNALNDQTFPFSSSYKEILKKQMLRPHTTLRSESEGAYANMYDIETVYPLADIRLMQIVIGLPTHFFKPKPFSRALFRNVCEGILPDKVRLQYKFNYANTLAFAEYFMEKTKEGLSNYKIKNHTGLMIEPDTFLNSPKDPREDKAFRLAEMKVMDYLIDLNWPV